MPDNRQHIDRHSRARSHASGFLRFRGMHDKAIFGTICERISNGESLREICRSEGMPDKSTVLRWLASDETIRDQYAHARELQADHFADEILEISDDGSNDWMLRKQGDDDVEVVNHEHISRSKLRVDSRKWLMSKVAPKKYGDRIDSTVKHDVADPLAALMERIASHGRRIHDKP